MNNGKDIGKNQDNLIRREDKNKTDRQALIRNLANKACDQNEDALRRLSKN